MAKTADVKTKKNEASVEGLLNTIKDEETRNDCFEIVQMMKKASKEEPKMWGSSIIGFGEYHYKYESGREGDTMNIGFSPRKQNITLYILLGADPENPLLKKLGKYTTGKGCLYIKKLADIDKKVLQELINESAKRRLNH
ncbi:MAG TPA: DUF1801 domain-containing protein [Anaerolineales bacterium]|nr:DUF1801 domain-containing protein [Anaerolineales bacterium]